MQAHSYTSSLISRDPHFLNICFDLCIILYININIDNRDRFYPTVQICFFSMFEVNYLMTQTPYYKIGSDLSAFLMFQYWYTRHDHLISKDSADISFFFVYICFVCFRSFAKKPTLLDVDEVICECSYHFLSIVLSASPISACGYVH